MQKLKSFLISLSGYTKCCLDLIRASKYIITFKKNPKKRVFHNSINVLLSKTAKQLKNLTTFDWIFSRSACTNDVPLSESKKIVS